MKTIRFSDLEISKEVKKAAQEMGFEEATQIQSLAIPDMMKGLDVIGQAQTGTGKTAAFGIPIIEKIDLNSNLTQALVMCPTRELCVQVAEQIIKFSKYVKGIKVIPIYGGQPIDRQIRQLKYGAQVIVCTPGRLIDHINRGNIDLSTVKIVVLDEADEMLNMGFIEDISLILEKIPRDRQTALFSATMPEPILKLTKRYQNDPKYITVVKEVLTADGIDQCYYEVKRGAKLDAIGRVLDSFEFNNVLMFCNTKHKVDSVTERLKLMGYTTEGLHGDKTQQQREKVMERFKKGKTEILVATDVAARGLDIKGLDAVINYHIPQDIEYYVHRIGRTGRAGKKGKALTFIYAAERNKIYEIEQYANVQVRCDKVPTFDESTDVKTVRVMDRLREELAAGNLERQTAEIEKLLQKNYSLKEVAAALLKIASLTDKREDDLNHNRTEMARLPEKTGIATDTVFINVGSDDSVEVHDIIDAIEDLAGVSADKIGKVEIRASHTYIELEHEIVDTVIRKIKESTVKGKKVQMEKVQ
ncbi:MAG: ATP-dependent RNA helicase [Candidatus Goldiibacteriota bacterium HGW-Goldbacteria-1]|nr:MAG: ATP-dependent RNA helicase [Candidatus Goldiibacteriota bacterium HGW-Goldbacteria-1]